MRSPIDSQAPSRAAGPRPTNGDHPAGAPSAGEGSPRTALLGAASGPPGDTPGLLGSTSGGVSFNADRVNTQPETGEREREAPSAHEVISQRAFQRFKRPTSSRPRTAFLGSPAIGRRPNGEASQGELTELDQHKEHSVPDEFEGSGGRGSRLLDLDSSQPLLTEEEINAFFDAPIMLESVAGADLEEEAPAEAPRALDQRPAWLKSQVADLADLVQALDLQARAHHAHVGLEDELTRLRQFTRTVGFVASPPPRGDQDFDMATLTEEALGALAGTTPNAPRILFRKRGDRFETIADKSLVAAALDAVLQTAVASAGSGDVIRITVEGRAGEPVVTDVEFPPGPLADQHPDDILAPYALRNILPGIGPNALAAAGAIAVGQGGDLTLTRDEEGTLTFTFELPGID